MTSYFAGCDLRETEAHAFLYSGCLWYTGSGGGGGKAGQTQPGLVSHLVKHLIWMIL